MLQGCNRLRTIHRRDAGAIMRFLWLIATIAIFSAGAACAQTTRFEAENAAVTGAAIVSDASASNGKYVDYNATGQTIQFNNVTASSAGSRTLTIRYANGRPNGWNSGTDVIVNGVNLGVFWDTNTGGWTNWVSGSFTINLNAGNNTIVLSSHYDHSPNIDYIEVPGTTNGSGGTVPAAPTGLTAAPGDGQIALAWSASSGATGYKVRYSLSSGGPYTEAASNVTATNFTLTGLTNGPLYYVVVAAFNGAGTSGNSTQVSATPSAAQANLMGINILGVSDYFEDRLFADAMKQARDFQTTTGGAISIDSNGWPNADFQVVPWHGIPTMNGTYKLRFNGQASSIATGFGSASVSGITYNSATNTTDATLVYNSTDGSGLQLTFTGTKRTSTSAVGTGVTNIQLMRPLTPGSTSSYAFGTTFTDQIKNAVAKFSVIRFMDYSATNSNAQVNWWDRVLPGYASMNRSGTGYGWQGKGGAWEYAIRLANETGKDAWINVPAKASDAYITSLAQTFRYGSDGVNPYTSAQANPVYAPLNANLKLYVEYSNELWNTAGAFQQSFQNKDAAVAEVNAGGSPLNYDGLTDSSGWQFAWRRIAKRGIDVSQKFRAVFGDGAMMSRVRPILMTQLGNAGGVLAPIMTFVDGYYNNPAYNNPARPANYYFYGAGGSAYYNPDNSSDTLTLSNIWDSQSFLPANFETQLKADIDLIAGFGLKRIAYEGGPSLDNTGHSESVKAAARDDARMKTEVLEHQASWSAFGGDLLVYFNVAGDYQWGFTGSIFNLNTPKFGAIDQLNGQARGAVTYGTLLPATINGDVWSVNNRGWGTPGTGSVTMNTGNDQYGTPNIAWTNYTMRASGGATYAVRVNYSSGNAGTLQVYFDGTLVGTVSVAAGASNMDSAAFSVTVAKGIHAVRVRCTAGPVTLNQVKVQ